MDLSFHLKAVEVMKTGELWSADMFVAFLIG